MRKYIFTMFAALFILGCKNTNENLVQDRGTAVVPAISKPSPAYFTDNLDASYVQFDLSLASSETIDKAELQVTLDDKSAIIKEISIPVKGLKVTAAEVIQALNLPVSEYKTGLIFNLYVLTTKNGITTRSKAAFAIPVVCYFDTSMLVGKFDWASDDWGENGTVNLVADPANPYKIYIADYAESEGLTTGNGNRIELDVDPNNFKISGPNVIIADNLAEWGLPNYHNYAYEPVDGSYSACDDAYTITFFISIKEGNWGNNVFIFTRAK